MPPQTLGTPRYQTQTSRLRLAWLVSPVPDSLCDLDTDGDCENWKGNPMRDSRGNIVIEWADDNQPGDRATTWLYTSSSGSWWSE